MIDITKQYQTVRGLPVKLYDQLPAGLVIGVILEPEVIVAMWHPDGQCRSTSLGVNINQFDLVPVEQTYYVNLYYNRMLKRVVCGKSAPEVQAIDTDPNVKFLKTVEVIYD